MQVWGHPSWIAKGQVVDGADHFDAKFWGVSKREATIMDPQQRMFLQTCWHALEHAGYPPRSGDATTSGSRGGGSGGGSGGGGSGGGNPHHSTGVFAACGIDGYLVHHQRGGALHSGLDPGGLFLTEVGSEKDYIATRVAYQVCVCACTRFVCVSSMYDK
jgi:acyl transferase domain-containing protein